MDARTARFIRTAEQMTVCTPTMNGYVGLTTFVRLGEHARPDGDRDEQLCDAEQSEH